MIHNNEDYITTLKKIDRLDVIRWVAEVWKEVPNKVIARSWNILLDHNPMRETKVENENNNLVSLLKKIPRFDNVNALFAEWMENNEVN